MSPTIYIWICTFALSALVGDAEMQFNGAWILQPDQKAKPEAIIVEMTIKNSMMTIYHNREKVVQGRLDVRGSKAGKIAVVVEQIWPAPKAVDSTDPFAARGGELTYILVEIVDDSTLLFHHTTADWEPAAKIPPNRYKRYKLPDAQQNGAGNGGSAPARPQPKEPTAPGL